MFRLSGPFKLKVNVIYTVKSSLDLKPLAHLRQKSTRFENAQKLLFSFKCDMARLIAKTPISDSKSYPIVRYSSFRLARQGSWIAKFPRDLPPISRNKTLFPLDWVWVSLLPRCNNRDFVQRPSPGSSWPRWSSCRSWPPSPT